MGFENFLADVADGAESGIAIIPIVLDVIVGVFLLIYAIIGFKKGFLKGLVGLLGTIIALVIAFSLTSVVVGFLNEHFHWNESMASWFEGMLNEKEGFSQPMTQAGVESALEGLGLPGFLSGMVLKIVAGLTNTDGLTIAQVVSSALAGLLLTAIVGVLIFIISAILLNALANLISKLLDKLPVLGTLNHFLGLLLGLVKALIFIYIILGVLSLLPFDSLRECLNQTYLISWMQENNLLLIIVQQLSSFDSIIKSVQDFINGLLNGGGEETRALIQAGII